jgi:hypothetical protein
MDRHGQTRKHGFRKEIQLKREVGNDEIVMRSLPGTLPVD